MQSEIVKSDSSINPSSRLLTYEEYLSTGGSKSPEDVSLDELMNEG